MAKIIFTKNIATLQSQVYKGKLKNTVNATERYCYIFMIVQHILDYKAETYNPNFMNKQTNMKTHPDVETLLVMETLPAG